MSKVQLTWCWIDPEGRQYPVPYEGHCDEAERRCQALGLSYHENYSHSAERVLERLNWVKVTTKGIIFVEKIMQITESQLSTLWDMRNLPDNSALRDFKDEFDALMRDREPIFDVNEPEWP